MANITTDTSNILSKTRGEDVRDSIASAMRKISEECLPTVDEEDSGKVLMVSASGKWEAMGWT